MEQRLAPIGGTEVAPIGGAEVAARSNERAEMDICPICREIPVMPRVLVPCAHVLCSICWVRKLRHDGAQDVACPLCRAMVNLAPRNLAEETRATEALGDALYTARVARDSEQLVTLALEEQQPRLPAEVLKEQQAALDADYEREMREWERDRRKLAKLRWVEWSAPFGTIFCGLVLVYMAAASCGWMACLIAMACMYCHKLEHLVPVYKRKLRDAARPRRVLADPQRARRSPMYVARSVAASDEDDGDDYYM